MGRGPRHETRQFLHTSRTTGQNLFLFLMSSLFRVSALSTQFLTLHTDNAITKNNTRGEAERPFDRERKRPREEAQTHTEGQLQHLLTNSTISSICLSPTLDLKHDAELEPSSCDSHTIQVRRFQPQHDMILMGLRVAEKSDRIGVR